MALDRRKRTLDPVNEQRAEHERNAHAQRIARQQHRAGEHRTLARRQHHRAAQQRARARRPTHGKHRAQQQAGEHALGLHLHIRLDRLLQQRDMQDTRIMQTEEDHDHAKNQIHLALIAHKQTTQRAREHAQQHKQHCEAQHKAQRARKRTPRLLALARAGKVEHVHRNHRQHARGNECDQALHKCRQDLQDGDIQSHTSFMLIS